MALGGASAYGVDVDPFLAALYSAPGDQGRLGEGSVEVVHGSWPKEVGTAMGRGFDLFLSKNTLKRGYLHPEQPVDPKLLVHLGVEDETFLSAVHDALRPGGLFLIYNLCPPQNPPGQKWIPWADGRCPFPRELLEKAGFTVLAFDADDGPRARALGQALGWEKSMGDLEKQLFAHYTLARR
jgi:SAM-dependent methyltransferase